jgi:hypothetical protein
MYIAVVMTPDGEPTPVWRDEDCGHMMTWESASDAVRDTQAMPISVQREIVVLDLNDGI